MNIRTTLRPNAGLLLVHRLRRWLNIKPTMGQCIVFAGLNKPSTPVCFTHRGGERPMQYQRPGKHDILKQCSASLADDGPALSQHWFNVPCLLGRGLAT